MWVFLQRILTSVFLALRAVRRNKLRAGLTTLGITIGVAAVVTVTALATAARANVAAQVQALGTNALMVFPRSSKPSGARLDASSRLSELDVKAMVRESTSIALAAPFLRGSGTIVYEGQNATPTIVGTRLDYFAIRNWKAKSGSLWTPVSENIADKVAVIGTATAKTLFGSLDPIGRTVRVGRFPFEIIGVLEEKGQSPFGQSQDEILVVPITTMRGTISNARPNETHAIIFSATSAETTSSAQRQAEGILRERHRIQPGQEDDFVVRSQAEFQALQDTIFGALTMLLIGIAAVSLVVGGIGVMNIMLVSVAERTREIGIRMAIGAREADIMVQFLVEALVLAFLGGLIGTTLGLLAIHGFGSALSWEMKLEPQSLLMALVTSTTIGLVFGYLPARRAARLDPVQALGRE
ncbi:MAG: ABC transporter permease [Polyangiaceae bacterium]